MNVRPIKILTLFFTWIFLVSSSVTVIAGKPVGPNKGQCNAAFTAVKLQDLNFGTFSAGTGGVVTVTTGGTRTATGGVTLAGGTVSAAIFQLNSTLPGCEIYPVTVQLPNNTVLTEPTANTMTANNYISVPATGFILIPLTPQQVSVGADVTAVAAQAGGVYTTSPTFTVRFRY